MANTIVRWFGPSGLSPTLELFPKDSDTLQNVGGDVLTEATNCKGSYTSTVSESLAGNFRVVVKVGSNVIDNGWVTLADDTQTYEVEDSLTLIDIAASATVESDSNTLDVNLVASWQMRESNGGTRWDHSPNRYHLHVFGRDNITALGIGTRFVSSDAAYLFATPQQAPAIFDADEFTIAFRFRFTDPAGQNDPIFSIHNTLSGQRGLTVYRTTSGKLALSLSSDGTAQNALATTASIVENKWHSAVIRYDGTNIKISLDGTEVTKAHSTGWNKPSGIDLEIGSYNNNGTRLYSDVDIDNLSFWDAAISNADRDTWYNSGKPLFYPFTDSTPTSLGQDAELPVLLVFGQSNAVGTALNTNLLESLSSYVNPKIPVWENFFNYQSSSSVIYDAWTFANTEMQNSTGFGPEVSIAQSFGDGIAILKYALGGSYLDSTGTNDWSADGSLRTFALQHYEAGFDDLRAAGYRPYVAGVLWVQGEADAIDADSAVAGRYATNLGLFFDWIESNFGENVPILCSRLNQTAITNYPMPNGATVRTAQDTVSAARPNVTLYDSDALTLKADNLHYDAQGQIELGEAVATWLRAVLEDETEVIDDLAIMVEDIADQLTDGTVDANMVSVNGSAVVSDNVDITVLGFVPFDGAITLTRKDTYEVSLGNPLTFTRSDYPDLSALGDTDAKLSIKDVTSNTTGTRLIVDHKSSVSVDNATKTIKFELNSTETTLDPLKKYRFDLELDYGSGKVLTIHRGPCNVESDITEAT